MIWLKRLFFKGNYGRIINGTKYENAVDFRGNARIDVKVYRSEDWDNYKIGFIDVNKPKNNFVLVIDDINIALKMSEVLQQTAALMEEDLTVKTVCEAEDILYRQESKKILKKYDLKKCMENLDQE
jgi:mevalonate kinase